MEPHREGCMLERLKCVIDVRGSGKESWEPRTQCGVESMKPRLGEDPDCPCDPTDMEQGKCACREPSKHRRDLENEGGVKQGVNVGLRDGGDEKAKGGQDMEEAPMFRFCLKNVTSSWSFIHELNRKSRHTPICTRR